MSLTFWVIFEKGSIMGIVAQTPREDPFKYIPKLIHVLCHQLSDSKINTGVGIVEFSKKLNEECLKMNLSGHFME